MYLLWILLWWVTSFAIVSSVLIYQSFEGFCGAILLIISLPITYQLGLDYCNFEECSNMFELDKDEKEDDDDGTMR